MDELEAVKLIHDLTELIYCIVNLERVGAYRLTQAQKVLALTLVEVSSKVL